MWKSIGGRRSDPREEKPYGVAGGSFYIVGS